MVLLPWKFQNIACFLPRQYHLGQLRFCFYIYRFFKRYLLGNIFLWRIHFSPHNFKIHEKCCNFDKDLKSQENKSTIGMYHKITYPKLYHYKGYFWSFFSPDVFQNKILRFLFVSVSLMSFFPLFFPIHHMLGLLLHLIFLVVLQLNSLAS